MLSSACVRAAKGVDLAVTDLRCEYRVNPLGVDVVKPRLSWVLESATRGQRQTAYRVLVASADETLGKDVGDLWDSGKVASDRTIHVVYAGAPLEPRIQCWWKVLIWDKDGTPSAWSEPATWSMGLIAPADWGGARWIADCRDREIHDADPMPATMLRKTFKLDGNVTRAVAHASGLGVYELRLNGKKVGDRVLSPEFTNYDKEILYQSYDVTDMLTSETNGVGVMLADGWNGNHFFGMPIGIAKNPFQGRRGFILRLDVEFDDGTTRTIVTDGSWSSTRESPLRAAGIYDGEKYDARLEWPGWDTGEFDDTAWRRAVIAGWIEKPEDHEGKPLHAGPELRWQRNQPMRVVKELKPVGIAEPKPGVFIIDLGQNMVGWCRVRVHGRQGTRIRMRHGEMLKEDGTLYTANLRRAAQTDTYIKGSDAAEVYEPCFTYHGFRYLEITGRTNIPWRYEPERRVYKPSLKDIVGCVVHSDAPQAGVFKCSNEKINKLMDAIVWTQRGNMHGIPTDCPQRDERAGWMGDIQTFAQTAIFNMDMAAFFSKWLRDVRHSQQPDGRYANFAPMSLQRWAGGTPAWADAGTIVPWRMYQNYADERLIAEHYDSAKRWVDYVHAKNRNLLWERDRGSSFNDWLNADKIKAEGWPVKGGEVPPRLLATAFFAHSSEIVAKMGSVLGKEKDAKTYGELADGIKAAFNKRYVQPDGKLEGDTQAGYALALEFNLLPEALRPKAAAHMVAGFERYDGHLSTGIQTTHRLMKELTRNGYNDEAWRLINLRTFPSWGFMLENGATTIWERWDGYVEGRGFQDPTMNSFNHWALGAVGEWIWRNVAGLNPDEESPGWRHFTIAPRPGGGVTWARGEYNSIRGRIVSDWRLDKGGFGLDATVPPNTTATVLVPVPAASCESVTVDGESWKDSEFVQFLGTEDGRPAFRVASGLYRFEAPGL
jgi:alpha-L-rhamnosidase